MIQKTSAFPDPESSADPQGRRSWDGCGGGLPQALHQRRNQVRLEEQVRRRDGHRRSTLAYDLQILKFEIGML